MVVFIPNALLVSQSTNRWCHDMSREQTANARLLGHECVFEMFRFLSLISRAKITKKMKMISSMISKKKLPRFEVQECGVVYSHVFFLQELYYSFFCTIVLFYII